MQERTAPHNALVRVVTKNDSVDAPQVLLARCDELAGARLGLQLLKHWLNIIDTRQRFGMGRQPVRNSFRIGSLFEATERREKGGYSRRIPSPASFVSGAQLIRLQFIVAAELKRHDCESLLGQLSEWTPSGHEDAQRDQSQLATDGARVLLRRMTGRHVTDFVANYPRKLRLAIEERKNAARDVDISAGEGECVHGGHIDYGEMPWQGGTLGKF